MTTARFMHRSIIAGTDAAMSAMLIDELGITQAICGWFGNCFSDNADHLESYNRATTLLEKRLSLESKSPQLPDNSIELFNKKLDAFTEKAEALYRACELSSKELEKIAEAQTALINAYKQALESGDFSSLQLAYSTFDDATRIPHLEDNQVWVALKDAVCWGVLGAFLTAVVVATCIFLIAPSLPAALSFSSYLMFGGEATAVGAGIVGAGKFLHGLFRERPKSLQVEKNAISGSLPSSSPSIP